MVSRACNFQQDVYIKFMEAYNRLAGLTVLSIILPFGFVWSQVEWIHSYSLTNACIVMAGNDVHMQTYHALCGGMAQLARMSAIKGGGDDKLHRLLELFMVDYITMSIIFHNSRTDQLLQQITEEPLSIQNRTQPGLASFIQVQLAWSERARIY